LKRLESKFLIRERKERREKKRGGVEKAPGQSEERTFEATSGNLDLTRGFCGPAVLLRLPSSAFTTMLQSVTTKTGEHIPSFLRAALSATIAKQAETVLNLTRGFVAHPYSCADVSGSSYFSDGRRWSSALSVHRAASRLVAFSTSSAVTARNGGTERNLFEKSWLGTTFFLSTF
jgi:hypothetical protein